MKRSKVLRKLTKLLQSWKGCQLDGETSKEILDLMIREAVVETAPKPGYQKFLRKGSTSLPKAGQRADKVVFLVQNKLAERFKSLKGPVTWAHIHMADVIIADGTVIKNVISK